ncbi:hypothetical protein FRACYDRAFT_234764 [Fragilariopsis cylindrus CCMP1102]|uniref:Uncharacterized protein n=1 Tax=Fragilariopsis cylindrus CCMP1102 TaxID=635003 RepID=A0A1E7FSQ1_9STRA|nr:hypothetical protein FRACYDRAFT_234764 [Fragilariopsis cylindrus CCMP1102]|eukprot:OEU21137.1 hypothetical protein FRACYDRAFT_234764 [Fragilariopsis cylindrus CCMP1102]
MLLAILFFLMASSSSSCLLAVIATNTREETTSSVIELWPPATSDHATVQDLHREYNNIFLHGNRNAASHRWATFLLDRSHQMSEATIAMFFTAFCAVSGSPVRPSDYNRYRLTLPKLGGGHSTGYMHYCCWPCVCDTQDFIRIDTKNITLATGRQQTFQFAVIGNPCDDPTQLQIPFMQPFDRRQTSIADSAREVRCLEDGALEGATLSDHGYVIINMFFDSQDADQEGDGVAPGAMEDIDHPTPGRMSSVANVDKSGRREFQDEREYKLQCEDRAKNGYNSGMGEIFRKVCAVSPINPEALKLQLPTDDCRKGVDGCNADTSRHNYSDSKLDARKSEFSHDAEINPQKIQAIHEEFGKLQNVLSSISGKLSGVLQSREDEFLTRYKSHMRNVARDFRWKMDEIEGKEKAIENHTVVKKLEKERDWYKSEAFNWILL